MSDYIVKKNSKKIIRTKEKERIVVRDKGSPGPQGPAGGSSSLLSQILLEWNESYPRNFKEVTRISGQITQVDVWDSPDKNIHLFSKVISYLASKISSILITHISSGATISKSISYDIDGNIVSVDKSFTA
jgi:hypothetical protein